ncbi:hypothetical protein EJ08DRAFT_698118 [Tothia fuscella]|uniref:Uncharacterized protein n=1 Tax=Tothia fuscella TaxID=1048955 RepID=A0A9P4TXU9_9PEZI|nr:hypothetical protein EJ08DRAFT_698118 [Tothia fuscella]
MTNPTIDLTGPDSTTKSPLRTSITPSPTSLTNTDMYEPSLKFLYLPAEIRNMIYDQAITNHPAWPNFSLIMTCKSIHNETRKTYVAAYDVAKKREDARVEEEARLQNDEHNVRWRAALQAARSIAHINPNPRVKKPKPKGRRSLYIWE